MKLTIDELTIEIPENFVAEYRSLLHYDEEQISKYLSDYLKVFRKSMVDGNDFNPETFEQDFIHYLDGDLDIFRK